MLFLDVNLGIGNTERVVIREGDTAEDIATSFCRKHKLDKDAVEKMTALLRNQMNNMLEKITEVEFE